MLKRIVFFSFLVCCCSTVFATVTMDNAYYKVESVNFPSNIPNITNPARSEWHNMNGAMVSVTSAPDGTVRGIDASGCRWDYADYPSNTWTKNTSACDFVKVEITFEEDRSVKNDFSQKDKIANLSKLFLEFPSKD